MKCTSRIGLLLTISMLFTTLCGCGKIPYEMDYSEASKISGFQVTTVNSEVLAESFASGICVVEGDVTAEDIEMANARSAILFDLNQKKVLYSKNSFDRLYPASLTKIMTALVALENGSLNQTLTATDNVKITESGAQLCNLKAGDTMTLDQALHILLLYSANDVANLIAENIGNGDINKFVNMMNDEARRLGATGTHFANPHGLHDEDHYTTAYDLYLIFNQAIQYPAFREIIQMGSYQTSYQDGNGREKKFDKSSTNRYVNGNAQAPDNITVIGGKTGTTAKAGHCLILLSKDEKGDSYISVILNADSNDYLYEKMTALLEKINN